MKTSLLSLSRITAAVLAVSGAMWMGGCATQPDHGGAPQAVVGKKPEKLGKITGQGDGSVVIMSNGHSNPPVYEVGSPSSTTGYVKVYFSRTTPTPLSTTWYLDGVSKGLVTPLATASFKITTRAGHTVSFTCLGNNLPPRPVPINLVGNQKVSIPIYYQ